MTAKWIPYNDLYWEQESQPFSKKWPKERKAVLLRLEPWPDKGIPASVCVGYLRFSAGDKHYPMFVMPGTNIIRGRKVTHFCDCLPDAFKFPYEVPE